MHRAFGGSTAVRKLIPKLSFPRPRDRRACIVSAGIKRRAPSSGGVTNIASSYMTTLTGSPNPRLTAVCLPTWMYLNAGLGSTVLLGTRSLQPCKTRLERTIVAARVSPDRAISREICNCASVTSEVTSSQVKTREVKSEVRCHECGYSTRPAPGRTRPRREPIPFTPAI